MKRIEIQDKKIPAFFSLSTGISHHLSTFKRKKAVIPKAVRTIAFPILLDKSIDTFKTASMKKIFLLFFTEVLKKIFFLALFCRS